MAASVQQMSMGMVMLAFIGFGLPSGDMGPEKGNE